MAAEESGRALGVVPALMVCPIDGGAGGELPGHRDRRPRDRSAVLLLEVCGVLSLPTFPAGELVFFIPLRVVAEESGAAHYDLPGLAGGAGADFFSVIFRFGATMELGRSERPTMRPLWSYRVDGADSPDRKPR